MRQDNDRQHFEKKRSEKRDKRRYFTVVECGEEGRSKDGKAHHHVGFAVQSESFFCHVKEGFIVAEEKGGEGSLDTEGNAVKDKSHNDDEDRALLKCPVKLRIVFDLVLVTEDRSDTDGKTEEYRTEEESDIHEDTVGSDTVQSHELHEFIVIHDAGQRMEDLTYELGSTIGEYLPHDGADPFRTGKMQNAIFACDNVDAGKHTAEHLRNHGGLRGTGDTEIHDSDEKIIEEEVDRSGKKVDGKTDLRAFCCCQETLENILKNIERNTEDQDAAIVEAHREHFLISAHDLRKRLQKRFTEKGQ